MEWKIIRSENDIKELMEICGGFHDTCIVSLNYTSGEYVDDEQAALVFSNSDTLDELQQRLADIERQMLEAIDQYDEYIERGISIDDRIAELSDEANILRSHIEGESAKINTSASTAARLQSVFEEIDACPMQLDEYNDTIVRQLIEKITVNSEEKSLDIQFIGGMTVTENMP